MVRAKAEEIGMSTPIHADPIREATLLIGRDPQVHHLKENKAQRALSPRARRPNNVVR